MAGTPIFVVLASGVAGLPATCRMGTAALAMVDETDAPTTAIGLIVPFSTIRYAEAWAAFTTSGMVGFATVTLPLICIPSADAGATPRKKAKMPIAARTMRHSLATVLIAQFISKIHTTWEHTRAWLVFPADTTGLIRRGSSRPSLLALATIMTLLSVVRSESTTH